MSPDRVDRYVTWVRNHRFFSVVIAAAAIIALIAPLYQVLSGARSLFLDSSAGLEIVEVRVVRDPWEAADLVRATLPELADSARWVALEPIDSAEIIAMHGHPAEVGDSMRGAWYSNFSQFPELALLDVLLRNVAPQSAVISRIDVHATRRGPPSDVRACLPLNMSAAYHVILDDSDEQVASARVAHRVGGNDADRIGILVGREPGASGGTYMLTPTLVYNRTGRLRLPSVEVDLGQGCGELKGQLDSAIPLMPASRD